LDNQQDYVVIYIWIVTYVSDVGTGGKGVREEKGDYVFDFSTF